MDKEVMEIKLEAAQPACEQGMGLPAPKGQRSELDTEQLQHPHTRPAARQRKPQKSPSPAETQASPSGNQSGPVSVARASVGAQGRRGSSQRRKGGSRAISRSPAADATAPTHGGKRGPSSIDPAQAVSRDDCSGSASLTGEPALEEADANEASRRSARTKRFKKFGSVDFAQMLSRGGIGSRTLDAELSCDTHGSLASAAESAPLERRGSINSPHTLPPCFALEALPRADSCPSKPHTPASRARRARKTPAPAAPKAAAAGEEAGEAGDQDVVVLCAKVLTNSDANSGRIILPRVSVEANLSFVIGYRAYSLAATDANGRSYEFVIKSWANGTEHRRVYVLEQAAPFIRAHRLAPGDAVGVCSDASGNITVLANTPEARLA